MKKTFFIITLIILEYWCLLAFAIADEYRAGLVKNVSGQAFIERDHKAVTVKANDILLENDTLVTGRNSSMGVILQDNSVLSIGSETRLQISKFRFEPDISKLSFIAKIKKGTMVYLSGLIAKLNKNGVQFESSTAICGIRGTHLAIKVEDADE